MGFIELLLLAIGLSMDAFAVSVCKGLAMTKINFKSALICGIWFGSFQALMPLLGYLLGASFAVYVNAIAPWIAFALLCLIGGNMLREALSKSDEIPEASLDIKTMFLMAVATSIDALAVGITFAYVPVSVFGLTNEIENLMAGVITIGITTIVLSCIGVKVGGVFGTRYKSKAELLGGTILILIGLKILLEHFSTI